MNPSPLLVLRGVVLAGREAQRPLIDGVSLAVRPGQRLAILGAEGSGKSTLMRLMAGLIPAQSGEITLFGHTADARAGRTEPPGVLFREPEAHFLTPRVGEEIALTPASRGVTGPELETRINEAMVWAGLPLDWREEPLAHLSAAQRGRVALAALHAARPRLLLADEPGGPLSDSGEERLAERFRRLCADRQMALVIFTSRPRRALRFAEMVLELCNGRLREYPAGKGGRR